MATTGAFHEFRFIATRTSCVAEVNSKKNLRAGQQGRFVYRTSQREAHAHTVGHSPVRLSLEQKIQERQEPCSSRLSVRNSVAAEFFNDAASLTNDERRCFLVASRKHRWSFFSAREDANEKIQRDKSLAPPDLLVGTLWQREFLNDAALLTNDERRCLLVASRTHCWSFSSATEHPHKRSRRDKSLVPLDFLSGTLSQREFLNDACGVANERRAEMFSYCFT